MSCLTWSLLPRSKDLTVEDSRRSSQTLVPLEFREYQTYVGLTARLPLECWKAC